MATKSSTVEVPVELERTLAKNAAAKKAWTALSPSHQREYATWISEAKKEETRISRAEKAATMLVEGKR